MTQTQTEMIAEFEAENAAQQAREEARLRAEGDWLRAEYIGNHRSARVIAEDAGVGISSIYAKLRKHRIPRRPMPEALRLSVPRGERHHAWRGGRARARGIDWDNQEWLTVKSGVRYRDKRTCRRCRLRWYTGDETYHVHHIEPFSNAALRMDPRNLVLLCVKCHRFVHSKRNRGRLFLPPAGVGSC